VKTRPLETAASFGTDILSLHILKLWKPRHVPVRCVICQSDPGALRIDARLPSEKRHDDDVTVARLSIGIRSLSTTPLSLNQAELNLYLSSVKNRPRSIPPRVSSALTFTNYISFNIAYAIATTDLDSVILDTILSQKHLGLCLRQGI
jgi:hypothetical protein